MTTTAESKAIFVAGMTGAVIAIGTNQIFHSNLLTAAVIGITYRMIDLLQDGEGTTDLFAKKEVIYGVSGTYLALSLIPTPIGPDILLEGLKGAIAVYVGAFSGLLDPQNVENSS